MLNLISPKQSCVPSEVSGMARSEHPNPVPGGGGGDATISIASSAAGATITYSGIGLCSLLL
mgnify:CR=1 FL=1